MRKLMLLIMVAMVAGCAHSGFSRLPQQGQQLWQRCYEQMAQANGCNKAQTSLGVISDATCVRYKMDLNEYISQGGTSARKTWLIAHGCPPYMVRPERY